MDIIEQWDNQVQEAFGDQLSRDFWARNKKDGTYVLDFRREKEVVGVSFHELKKLSEIFHTEDIFVAESKGDRYQITIMNAKDAPSVSFHQAWGQDRAQKGYDNPPQVGDEVFDEYKECIAHEVIEIRDGKYKLSDGEWYDLSEISPRSV